MSRLRITSESGVYSYCTITDDGCGRGVETHDQPQMHGDVQDQIIAAIDAGFSSGNVTIDGQQMMWSTLAE